MKAIIKNLEKQHKLLVALVQKRNDKAEGMSEAWQDSDKFEEWEDKTIDIDEKAIDLHGVIIELKELT